MRYYAFSMICYATGMASIGAAFYLLAFHLDSTAQAIRADLVLRDILVFLIFPLQHSLMARTAWKQWISRHIHPLMERPLYVGASGLALGVTLTLWEPFGPILYEAKPRFPFYILFFTSLVLILWTTKVIGHSRLFGLEQGRAAGLGKPLPETPLSRSGLFRHVRHPLTSLLIVLVWSHPTLTASRLLMNALITAYSLLGVILEEKDLVKKYGAEYEEYRRQTPAFIPSLRSLSGSANR